MRYWIGVVDPETNAGYGFHLTAETIDKAREDAAIKVEAPYIVNGVGISSSEGTRWLWSRLGGHIPS